MWRLAPSCGVLPAVTAEASSPRIATLIAPALLTTALAAGAWLALIAWRPTTTWHLAPALVAGAGAWVAAQYRTAAQTRWWIVAVAAFGLLAALGELAVFHATGRLEGPALLGLSGVAESSLTATVGAASGVIASFRRVTP